MDLKKCEFIYILPIYICLNICLYVYKYICIQRHCRGSTLEIMALGAPWPSFASLLRATRWLQGEEKVTRNCLNLH